MNVAIQETHWSTTVASDLLKRFASGVAPETNERVAQLFTQLGEALDAGHTVVALSAEQTDFYNTHSHPLIMSYTADDNAAHIHDDKHRHNPAANSQKPIVIQQGLAYFHRQWHQENTLARKIHALLTTTSDNTSSTVDLTQLPESMHERQRAAVEKAIASRFTLITGGPGTGKTWTVAQLVLTLLRANPDISIALAAPTGKAAQRMQEALQNSIDSSLKKDSDAELLSLVNTQLDQAKTIHRLLGLGFNTAPRFHAGKPLPYDLVIVDEASMLGVALANQLMQAIGAHTRIILLGDANQLAAVDAGAVLADVCNSAALQQYHVNLTESTRFTADSGVGQLAAAVLANKPSVATEILKNHADVSRINPNTHQLYEQLWQPFMGYAEMVAPLFAQPIAQQQSHIAQVFEQFDTYRILTATHAGKLGDTAINQHMAQLLKQQLHLASMDTNKQSWFHGRAVMMLKNDYQLKLANGDVGIALMDDQKTYQVYFPSLSRPLAANRLSENTISTAFAMTIHKSQGSEFNQVAIVLDAPVTDDATGEISAHNLLSRELIYTAITRAKKHVVLYATDATTEFAISTKAVRQTGLGQLLHSVPLKA